MHAVVFPGQGSQEEGMARTWQDHPAFARWAEADEVLGRDVTRLGLHASADELREPRACQVALFVHHAVLLAAWRGLGAPVGLLAGHSLGEYDALLAAGALDFADALRLVDARARLTGEAAEQRPGSMVACLGLERDAVEAAAREAGAHVANDNAPGQIVVSGAAEALERLRDALSGERGKVVPLEVGAAYHSPHMEPAVAPFGAALDAATFADAEVPVVANVDAAPHVAAGEWPQLLRRQLTAPVRWRETVEAFVAAGVEQVTELAAKPVLSGLVKRTARSLERRAVTTPDDLASSAEVVA
jgi:[acyl-carrier-protein] S-malonyltransferase